MVLIKKIDHVQLAMPSGKEDSAREFYNGILGIPEVKKPMELAKRGGVWFESDCIKIHLGVDKDFIPAKKAHPGLEVGSVEVLSEILSKHGYGITQDHSISDCIRIFVNDPFGNRLEFLEWST